MKPNIRETESPGPSGRRGTTAWCALVVAVAVSMTSAMTASAATIGAADDPSDTRGQIVNAVVVDAPEVDGTVEKILYRSQTVTGAETVISGLIVRPNRTPPPGGFPVVSWAHGTTGMADSCAPSAMRPVKIPSLAKMLARGWAVVATDYEGLGTPGLHPYLVGDSEAHAVIDIVRAARNVWPGDLSDDYAIWGHSQGGHATLFGLHRSDDYGAGLHLVGAVASAPPGVFAAFYPMLRDAPSRDALIMFALGINAGYGDATAPLDEVLSPAGQALAPLAETDCSSLRGAVQDVPLDDLLAVQGDGSHDPHVNPTWGPLIDAQDPFEFTRASSAPLLINHGTADVTVPVIASELIARQLCSVGQDTERWVYPGQSHNGVFTESGDDTLAWIADRFAGLPTSDRVVPHGDVEVATCVAGAIVAPSAGPSGTGSPDTVPPARPGGTTPEGQASTTPVAVSVPARAVRATPAYTG